MSTKYFEWDGGATAAIAGRNYTDGNPVEFQVQSSAVLAIQGWHNIAPGQRTAIIQQLTANGWKEGEQSKPD